MTRTLESITKHIGALPQMKSQTMKAIRIHNYGGPEVLQYEAAPRPKPGKGEVLIRVHAAGVNRMDWRVRAGYMKDLIARSFAFMLGWVVSGVIVDVGPYGWWFRMGGVFCSVHDVSGSGA